MIQTLEKSSPSISTANSKNSQELSKLSPEKLKEVSKKIENDSRFKDILSRTGSISGALWKGWEKGVNGSFESLAHGVKSAGKFMGESSAELIHGEKGGFVDKMVKDTQGIRDGHIAAGNFIGKSAAVISESSLSETVSRTNEYWTNIYREGRAGASKKSAEDIAYGIGNVGGGVAVGVVTGYALKAAQTSSILGRNIDLGSKFGVLDKWISQSAQLGIEYAGGRHLDTKEVTVAWVSKVLPKNIGQSSLTKEQIISNSKLTNVARLEQAEITLRSKWLLVNTEELQKLWLLDSNGKLTDIAKTRILAGHNVGKPVFEQDFASIKEKAQASVGLPKSWKKELMDTGLMGSEWAAKANTLQALKTTQTVLANQLESLIDPNRQIKFWIGTMGKDWAKQIIDSTLEPLAKARPHLTPELFAEIQQKTLASVESQLSKQIINRLNGNTAWVESLGLKDCFEALATKGYRPNIETVLPKTSTNTRMRSEVAPIIDRANLSASWIQSVGKVQEIRDGLSVTKKWIIGKLNSPTLNEEGLGMIKKDLTTIKTDLEKKYLELQDLQKQLTPLKETSIQEGKAKQSITISIASMREEIASLDRFQNSSEILTATRKVKEVKPIAKAEPVKLDEKLNATFMWKDSIWLVEQTRIMLSNSANSLSPENLLKYFQNSFPRAAGMKKDFTPEKLAVIRTAIGDKVTDEYWAKLIKN